MRKTILVLVSLFAIITMSFGACESKETPTPESPAPMSGPNSMVTPTIEMTNTEEPVPVVELTPEPTPTPMPMPEPITTPTLTPTPTPEATTILTPTLEPTLTPTSAPEPTPTPTPTPLKTEKLTDETSDLMDKNGKKVTAEGYLDIVEEEILYFGTYYTIRVKLNDKIPEVTDPSYNIQYLCFIDGEGTPNIGWHYTLLANDTSADYFTDLFMIPGGMWMAKLVDLWNDKTTVIECHCNDDYIEMTFPVEAVNKVKSFYFVIAACKFETGDVSSDPLVIDKLPNKGHGVFMTKG
jgi:hypothetical protein